MIGILNGGCIRSTIGAGDVTMKDVYSVLPFSDVAAVVYVTGSELLEALEASTYCTPDPIGGFPQTSGIEWTLDTGVPYAKGKAYAVNGKESSYYAPASIGRVRIDSVNGEPFDPDAVYAVVTTRFVCSGGDTYNAFYRAYERGDGFDTGIVVSQMTVEYVRDVMGGTITSDRYGSSRGSLTIAASEALEPAA